MELDHLRYETHDGVAEIVLDRPEVLNALSAGPGGTRDQILAALAEAGADPAVGAVVLHGAGRAFCSGATSPGTPDARPRRRSWRSSSGPTPSTRPSGAAPCRSSPQCTASASARE